VGAITPTNCERWANFYRCQTFDSYVRSGNRAISRELRRAIDLTTNIECDVSAYALFGNAPAEGETWRQLLTHLALVEAQAREAIAEIRSRPRSEEDHDKQIFFWNALLMRIGSIREQILMIPRGR
jgi:hypothetical protein